MDIAGLAIVAVLIMLMHAFNNNNNKWTEMFTLKHIIRMPTKAIETTTANNRRTRIDINRIFTKAAVVATIIKINKLNELKIKVPKFLVLVLAKFSNT